MKILIGNDHRGKKIRDLIFKFISSDHNVTLIGDNNSVFSDYPDIAAIVASDVASGRYERGILICGTSIGMCIVANKFPGVRAAPCHNEVMAELSRRHNDANILCLAGDILGEQTSLAIVEKWLGTPFESGRHTDRLEKIKTLENQNYSDKIATENSEMSNSDNKESNVSNSNQPVSGVA
jgi:ribose 5-phosphate isomerase B